MLKSWMQKLSVSNNIYTWWYDDEFELSDILDFARDMFPELKDLTLILGDHGNEGWEHCDEHQESHGDLRLIDIDKNFLEMERRLTNYGPCRVDNYYWNRDEKQEQFYNDAEEYRVVYRSYTSLDEEFWKNITFKVQMRAYFDEGNAGWDYTQFFQPECGKGAALYRSPAFWIETLQYYVPCDANGENIASKHDGLVELFEGYQPKFESWFRRERVSMFPEAKDLRVSDI